MTRDKHVECTNFTVRLPKKYTDELDQLVKHGCFVSKTEAIRAAIRKLLKEYEDYLSDLSRQAVEHPYGGDKKEAVAKEAQK